MEIAEKGPPLMNGVLLFALMDRGVHQREFADTLSAIAAWVICPEWKPKKWFSININLIAYWNKLYPVSHGIDFRICFVIKKEKN
ncbi:MAG: hypothetical protein NTX75_10580 [Proteobacteria bacterium]|nr:hypothetical protein [Pseudomonadota bacterium]